VSLSRRAQTLLVAGLLFGVLFVVAFTMPVPYVVLSPGPTLNTLGADNDGKQIISISGHSVRSTTGHLNLTTVSLTRRRITAVQALVGWLEADQVVVPRAAIYPPGQTEQQVDQRDNQDFSASQDTATAAALCELGYPRGFGVVGVDKNSLAKGKLQPGDKLVSLSGESIDSRDKLTAVLKKQQPGLTVPMVVIRDNKSVPLQVSLSAANGGGARIGITVADGCLAPFEVDLGLTGQIGGPSAGLMFALGIVDKVGTQDLTNGRFIAGTGEITSAGVVQPIGGIQLKMIAARRAGATVFLAPQGNCGDVRGAIPKGLDVVKVTNLHDAVDDLLELRQGGAVPHC
jgi:PDZ domain-containing protein